MNRYEIPFKISSEGKYIIYANNKKEAEKKIEKKLKKHGSDILSNHIKTTKEDIFTYKMKEIKGE